MFRNFLKTTYRSLRRNYVYTIINVLGLAIGISGTLLLFFLYDYEAKFDHSLGKTENIYRINSNRLYEGKVQPWGITPMPMGPDIKTANENIQAYCRYGLSQVLLKHEDIVHSENIYFADSNFFDLFHYETLRGNTSSFHRKNEAVVTNEFAKKYFGDEDPIGKRLSVILNDKEVLDFVIGAVLDKVPKNSSFQFPVIIPYDNVYDLYRIGRSDWTMQVATITYIKLTDSGDRQQVATELKSFAEKNNAILQDWQVRDYYLMPFKDQKKESHFLYSSITWPGLPVAALWGSLFLNTVILLISCFNFTNTALAFARKRLKEIGIRKIFGGVKRQIVIQFMTENLIQCFIALFIAMYIANIWLSWMNTQWPIELKDNYLDNPPLLIFLFCLLFGVALIAGAYPSFFVARFRPAHILKGDLKFSGTNIFTRVLLTLQFGFSVLAVFSAVVLYLNAKYQTKLDWGYNRKSVIVVPMHEEGNLEIYKNAAQSIPGVTEVAGTVHNAGFGYENATIDINGEPHQTHVLLTGDHYISTIGMRILQGRDFIAGSDNDRNESVLVNEKFIQSFGIKDPLSQVIRIENHTYYIVGVVKDFMPYGLMSPVNPVVLRSVPDRECTQLCVHAGEAQLTGIYDILHDQWKKLFPMKPFDGYYQDQAAGEANNVNNGILVQFSFMGLFALILSMIGLYSMVSLSVNKRIKEIGIRKVLGASTSQIIQLVNREFIIILLIACLFGCVSGYYFMDKFLADIFTYYLKIGTGAFTISVGLILATALVTSGRKILSAAHTDPARSLRYE